MAQSIAIGTRVWVSTSAPRITGPVVRDRRYSGTVLRQNPYETTHYPVKLDVSGQTVVVNDSMLATIPTCQHVWPDRTLEDMSTEFTCTACGEVVAYW